MATERSQCDWSARFARTAMLTAMKNWPLPEKKELKGRTYKRWKATHTGGVTIRRIMVAWNSVGWMPLRKLAGIHVLHRVALLPRKIPQLLKFFTAAQYQQNYCVRRILDFYSLSAPTKNYWQLARPIAGLSLINTVPINWIFTMIMMPLGDRE